MKRLILIGSLLTLGACGGGGGGDSGSSATQSANPASTTQPTPPPTSSTPPPDTGSGSTSGDSNICFSGFEVFYCDSIINIGGSGGASGDRQPPPEPVLVSTEAFDVEPNHNYSTASVATFAYRQASHEILGFHASGSVNRYADPGDWYSFSVRESGYHEFRLCETNTECGFESRDGRIDLADASVHVTMGNNGLMADVDGNKVAGNVQEFWIDSGITHYVLVAAETLDEGDVAYRLQVLEASSDKESVPLAPNAPVLYDQVTQSDFTITIDWLPPTEYDDGSVLSDISGYVIYVSTEQGGPHREFEVLTNPGLSSHTFNLPDFGTWYFVMTTINSAGVEGDCSNEIRVEAIDFPDPATDGTI